MAYGKWIAYVFRLKAFCAGIEDDAEREDWIQRLAKADGREKFDEFLRGEVNDQLHRKATGTLYPGEVDNMKPDAQRMLRNYADSILNPPSPSEIRKRERREKKKLRKAGLLKPRRKRLRRRKRG